MDRLYIPERQCTKCPLSRKLPWVSSFRRMEVLVPVGAERSHAIDSASVYERAHVHLTRDRIDHRRQIDESSLARHGPCLWF